MAKEKRLIDLDKAFAAINQEVWWTESEKAYFRSFIAKQPKVDAVEVVHGRWIEKEEKIWNLEKPIVTGWECSKCGEMYGHYTYNYCPNCGADMRERKLEDDN